MEVKEGHILVQGYAWSGGGQKIVRVDVTADGGDTWHVANLESEDGSEAPSHWSWTLWSVRIPVKDGLKTVGYLIWFDFGRDLTFFSFLGGNLGESGGFVL